MRSYASRKSYLSDVRWQMFLLGGEERRIDMQQLDSDWTFNVPIADAAKKQLTLQKEAKAT
jgi:hypothetical protein